MTPTIVKVIKEGRVTIPNKIREKLGIVTGDFVEIEVKKVGLSESVKIPSDHDGGERKQ